MSNDFSQLDAQSPVCSFATMTPEEHEEYQAYLDAQPLVHNDEPDAHLDAAYEERTELQDEPHGWPGDGSGEDDLADLMAHGDEGCCDGPND